MDIIARTIEEVAGLTMALPPNLAFTIECAIEAIDAGRPGDLVECGVWMGGSSFAMLLAQRYRYGRIVKPVWMFDSFEGLPPAEARDGPAAAAWQSDVNGPLYHDNCRAPLERVRAEIDRFGFTGEEAIVVPGWFADSTPVHRPALAERGIAFLRIDCDWYDPVHYVLSQFAPLVPDEGRILLDDYYVWDGCARATHAFLTENDLAWRIRTMPQVTGAYMVKRPYRTDRF